MIIKKIHIDSFGVLKARDFELSSGLNVISGENESGKTSLSMFIKFIFYGLSSRASGSSVSERRKYVNWDTGAAAGYLILDNKKGEYRIERNLTVTGLDGSKESARERVAIIEASTNTQVYKGVSPAEVFLGVPEEVFVSTVFISQGGGAEFDCGDVMSALENMIRSGDEKVNSDKAYSKLDDARRQLLYKNGSGGRIAELKRELAEAEASLAAAREKAAATIEAELSYNESERRKSELDAKNTELTELCAAYDAIYVKRALEASSAAERRTAELKNKISALELSPTAGLEAEKKYVMLEAEYKTRSESANNAEKSLEAFLGEKNSIGELADSDAITAQAELYSARMRSFLAAAVCVLFFACLGGGAAYLLYKINGGYEIVLAASAFFLALGVILLIARASAKRSVKMILAEWNVTDEGDLDRAIEAYNRSAKAADADAEEYRRLATLAESERSQLELLSGKVKAFAEAVGVRCSGNTAACLAEIGAAVEQNKSTRAELKREFNSINGRLAILREQIGTPDRAAIDASYEAAMASPVGEQAAKMDSAAISAARRERDFTASALKSQLLRAAELEKRLAVLRAGAPSPALESMKVEKLKSELAVATERYEAYMLAMKTLTAAAENVRGTLTPRILGRACSLLHSISGGKYKALGLSRNFEMSYTKGGETRSVDYLSGGSRDMAYIALRLALLDVVFGDDPPAAVFDESFMSIDKTRRARLYELLSAEDAPQTVVTSLDETCTSECANVIRLS